MSVLVAPRTSIIRAPKPPIIPEMSSSRYILAKSLGSLRGVQDKLPLITLQIIVSASPVSNRNTIPAEIPFTNAHI